MKASWKEIKKYEDINFEIYNGVAKVTINRPKVYNAFRPETNIEMLDAFEICRERNDIDIVVITGIGDKAFCSGGDQNVKGTGGYIGDDGVPRLNVLDLHKRISGICMSPQWIAMRKVVSLQEMLIRVLFAAHGPIPT